jgi:hypothetical protein
LSSLLVSLASQVLILKRSFRGIPKVLLGSSGTTMLVTTGMRDRVACERNRENSMGLRTHKSIERPRENIEMN